MQTSTVDQPALLPGSFQQEPLAQAAVNRAVAASPPHTVFSQPASQHFKRSPERKQEARVRSGSVIAPRGGRIFDESAPSLLNKVYTHGPAIPPHVLTAYSVLLFSRRFFFSVGAHLFCSMSVYCFNSASMTLRVCHRTHRKLSCWAGKLENPAAPNRAGALI